MREDTERVVRGRMRTFVLAAFAVLALLFAGMALLTVERVRETQQHTRLLVDNMLESVRLVSAMGRDVDRERLLLDEHIFEKGAPRMRQLEWDMADVEADFRTKATAYEPIVTLPGEREVWDRLQREVMAAAAETEQSQFDLLANRTAENYARMRANGVSIIEPAPVGLIAALREAARQPIAAWKAKTSPEAVEIADWAIKQ